MNLRSRIRLSLRLPVLLAALFPAASAAADKLPPPPDSDGARFFESRVRPILVQHCYACHSAGAKKVKGGLRLDTRAGVLAGGTSGPAVVPGDPAKSLLVRAVRHADESLRMPPKAKLPASAIADLEAWVKMGAPDPRAGDEAPPKRLDLDRAGDFWSFRPVADPPLPAVKDPDWRANPIDRFIFAKLEAKGLRPVPSADRRTLLRRATFDLTGLPPTPEEIDAFLKDDSPDAFVKVVDRLLASPAYGERWGRHWLDVVRYADTAGDNSDYPIPQMYRYRNWVIDAFNRDLPYDDFVRRQLAGDLLPAADDRERAENLIATGYLANARRFGSYEDDRYPWHLTIEDTIDNLGRTFLGLTVGCARCHDHKFDPISQADYYALYGFFQSTRYPWPGIELDKVQRDLVPLAPPDRVAAFEKERREGLARLDARVKKLEADRKAAEKALREAEKGPDKGRTADAKKKFDDLDRALKAARKERDQFAKRPPPFAMVYAVAEGKAGGKKKVGNACVQIKGDPEHLGPEVPRRFPTVLGGQELPPRTKGSGRLELAKWVTDPANPLFARAMVNRVWQWHFGKGLVPTPSNFGFLGRPPTHPELLDHLTRRFVEDGWSIKSLHRRIMLSRAYQLSSRDDPGNARVDAGNDFLWRFDRRRLDAESIRDALLVVGGNLDRTPAGPHPFPDPAGWNFTQHNPFKAVYDTNRRSVYLMTQRIQRHPFLALFDGADTNAGTPARTTSTTPLQALYLMNDPFVHAQARKLAARLRAGPGTDAGRVGRAYLLLFARPPAAEETAAATAHLARVRDKLRGEPADRRDARAWESLARALFLNNEFVYLD